MAAGNMDTTYGQYDHDILIRINLRTSKIFVLNMQEKGSILNSRGFSLSNDTRFTMLVEGSR